MTAKPMPKQPDELDYDPDEASCPPEVIAELRRRMASLDRGEGLTTDELRARLHAKRQPRRG